MAAPVPRPARHSQPFPVLAALACLAGALWLRRAASAPRAAPPPPPPLTLPPLRRTGWSSAQFLAPGLGRDMWPQASLPSSPADAGGATTLSETFPGLNQICAYPGPTPGPALVVQQGASADLGGVAAGKGAVQAPGRASLQADPTRRLESLL